MWLEYRVILDLWQPRSSIGGTTFEVDIWLGRTTDFGERQYPSLPEGALWKRAAYVGVKVFLIGRLNHKDDVVFGFEG